MSRIGKMPITVPSNVTVTIDGSTVTAKGPKGELSRTFRPIIKIEQDGDTITVSRPDDSREAKAQHGLVRTLVANMIEGVKNGFEKNLEIVGIGYRAQMKGNKLVLNVGFSHPVEIDVEEGVKVECPSQTQIKVSGISKERVGEVAAQIRAVKKPEPYKGKGIKYTDERIIRKEGKTAGKK
jgi:large subunit ribosomal protein L6